MEPLSLKQYISAMERPPEGAANRLCLCTVMNHDGVDCRGRCTHTHILRWKGQGVDMESTLVKALLMLTYFKIIYEKGICIKFHWQLRPFSPPFFPLSSKLDFLLKIDFKVMSLWAPHHCIHVSGLKANIRLRKKKKSKKKKANLFQNFKGCSQEKGS